MILRSLLIAVCCISGSIVCEKVDLADQEGETNDLCYKEQILKIKCPRNQTLLIPTLLQRTYSPQENKESNDCAKSVRDQFYDIGRCLLNTSDEHERTAYGAAVREVLGECSQKRYCILESDKTSSIRGLKDLPVGEDNRNPSHLAVGHQCVKEQVASVVLCDRKTQTDTEVYISINRLRMSALGTSTCTCTVRGAASQVTLLDVRLGSSNRTRLSIRDNTRPVYTTQGGQQALHFMKEIRLSQTEWSLHVDVVKDHLPDKIWMRVEGYNGMMYLAKVTVTCEEPKAAIPIPMLPRSLSGEHVVFVCVGFVTGLVFAGVTLCALVKRRSRHSGSRTKEGQDGHWSQLGESRVQQPIGSPDGDEPHYHMPDDPCDLAQAPCNDYDLVPVHRQPRETSF